MVKILFHPSVFFLLPKKREKEKEKTRDKYDTKSIHKNLLVDI